MRHPSDSAPVTALRAHAYRIPTDCLEADGTFQWNATTLVLAYVEAAGETGMGYTYADASIASLIDGVLLGAIKGQNAFDIPACWMAMWRVVRNFGRSGLAACAISAVDTALWDLKGACRWPTPRKVARPVS
jgi:L-alanine-DL-glutamate epimerase-like enolase superfamily enzyme